MQGGWASSAKPAAAAARGQPGMGRSSKLSGQGRGLKLFLLYWVRCSRCGDEQAGWCQQAWRLESTGVTGAGAGAGICGRGLAYRLQMATR